MGVRTWMMERKWAYPHFDGENFYHAQERLKFVKTKIDQLMSFLPSGRQIEEAQFYLGRQRLIARVGGDRSD